MSKARQEDLAPHQVKNLVYNEMVTFEHLVKQVDDTSNTCRNGLKILQHPKKYYGKLNRNKPDVGFQIDSLAQHTDRMYD